MLLICPQCDTRYEILASALGDNGRTVKCKACAHRWTAYPEGEAPTPAQLDEEEVATPLEESTAPAETAEPPEEPQSAPEPESTPKAEPQPQMADGESKEDSFHDLIGGYVAASLVFLAVLVGLFMVRGALVQAWPSAQAMYGLLGVQASIPGEGLIFEQVKAVMKEEDHVRTLNLKGQVINLTDEEKTIPPIRVSFLDEDGHEKGGWFLPSPATQADAESMIDFDGTYPAVPVGVQSVRLHFTNAVQTEDDDTAPQEDHAAEDTHEDAHQESHDTHAPAHDAHH